MKPALLLVLVLGLAACRDETAQAVDPLPLTEQSVGYFCQMNLVEHDGPKGQIHLDGLPGAPLFFSQVRDAVAYLRLPEQSHRVLAVWVNDMGAPDATWQNPGRMNWIDASTAYFVVGSSQAGGMGAPELVPFSRIEAARAFAADFGGEVMTLDAIPDEAVLAPESGETGDDPEFDRRLRALSQKTGG